MLPVPRCGRRNDDNKYATTTTKTGKLQGRQGEKQREIEWESGSRRATAFGATPNSLYTLRARLTGISTASWCKKFLHSRTLNHLQTGSNHLPGQHPPTDTASPHPIPSHSLLFSTIFVYKLLLVCILCEASCWAKGGSGRWAGDDCDDDDDGSCCYVCIVHKGLTAGRSHSPHPHFTSPCPAKVQRVAPKVAKFSPLFFRCLVPLNRQIPDAIMRRLVKLSHSRTASQSAIQVGSKYT